MVVPVMVIIQKMGELHGQFFQICQYPVLKTVIFQYPQMVLPYCGVPRADGVYYTQDFGTSWGSCTGAPVNSRPIADRTEAKYFYIVNQVTYKSTDYGVNFSQSATLPGTTGRAYSTPGIDGDIWVPIPGYGLYHSVTYSANYQKVASVQNATAVALGKSAPNSSYPSIFMNGEVNNVTAIFRSDDEGVTWNQISDSLGFGGYGNNVLAGDPRVFGRVFISTGGRGIITGEAYDCMGVLNGTAYKDSCGNCVGGTSGNKACNVAVVPSDDQVQAFQVYPNPFTKDIELKCQSGSFQYSILNLMGQNLESNVCYGDCKIGESLNSGVYLVVLRFNNDSQIFKVIKQ